MQLLYKTVLKSLKRADIFDIFIISSLQLKILRKRNSLAFPFRPVLTLETFFKTYDISHEFLKTSCRLESPTSLSAFVEYLMVFHRPKAATLTI